MSFKPQAQGVNESTWTSNGLAFATHKEADEWSKDLFSRWMGCQAVRVIESDEPVNYTYLDRKLEMIKPAPEAA